MRVITIADGARRIVSSIDLRITRLSLLYVRDEMSSVH